MDCKKCETEMYKKETLNISNAEYDIFECKVCGEEKTHCKGVVD